MAVAIWRTTGRGHLDAPPRRVDPRFQQHRCSLYADHDGSIGWISPRHGGPKMFKAVVKKPIIFLDHVHDLFFDPVDVTFDVHHELGDRSVVGLGADRVRLAEQFLGKKLQRPTRVLRTFNHSLELLQG